MQCLKRSQEQRNILDSIRMNNILYHLLVYSSLSFVSYPLLLICVAFELPISSPFAQHKARRSIAADYHYGFGVPRECVFMLFNKNAQSCIVLKWKSKREGIDKLCSSEDRLAN